MAVTFDQPVPAAPLSHSEIRAVIFGLMLAMFLAALDQTIVATALPTIGRDLGDFADVGWVVSSYLLASTAVTPLYGKVSDMHGRRVTLVVAISVFIVGSIACALAPTMLTLILARALQGLGGGGLIALAQTIIADVVAPKERGRYQVYIASVFVCASLAGPLLGGVIAEHVHWSWIFWINLPLGLLAVWTSLATLRRLPQHHRPHRLDVQGAVLMVVATVTLMLALTSGGHRYAWTSPQILGLVAASAIASSLLAVRLRLAPEPFIPVTILANPVVRTATLAVAAGMGILTGLSIYTPIYFEGALGLTASQSGVALMPMMAGTVVGAVISGRAMSRVRRYKIAPMIGVAIAVAIGVVLTVWGQRLSLVTTVVLLGALSSGLGTLFPVATVSIQNAVALYELGTATAVANFFRQIGGAVTVAAFGAILIAIVGPAAIAAGPHPAAGSGADPALLRHAFSWVFAGATLGLVIAYAALLVMPQRPLRSGVSNT